MRRAYTNRRAARRRRGAVLVEGLVVSAMLALFLACVVFVHALYTNKMAGIATAREQAWTRALPGCGGGLAMGLLNSVGVITALNEVDESSDSIDLPDWMANHARGVGEPAAVTVTTSAPMTAASFSLQTRTSVACNEVADDENGSLFVNLADVIRNIW
jgi:hypothetical protein